MDINKLIKQEAPRWEENSPVGVHDEAYREVLLTAHEQYCNRSQWALDSLKGMQSHLRRISGTTQGHIAQLMVLNELIKEREKEFDAKEQTD